MVAPTSRRDGECPGRIGVVAFHSDFWVVAGTAAPVIALAAVVAVKDILPGLELLPRGKGRRASTVAYYSAAYNLVMQTAVLGVSLESLSEGQDFFPRWPVTITKCAGIVALVVSGVATLLAKEESRRLYRERLSALGTTQVSRMPHHAVASTSGTGSRAPGRTP
jgi:hypothetical protein